jgi:anaerobic C4-dicarboxylate transporter
MATSSDQLVHEDLETEVDVDSTIVSTTSSSSPSPAPAGLYVYLATAVARFLRAHPDHATVLRPMVLPLRHTLEKMDATASIREALLRLPA